MTARYRAHYVQPAPAEFDVEWPDDIDGPDDEAEFLFDNAPMWPQCAVRVEPVEQDAPGSPPPDATTGLSGSQTDPCQSGAGSERTGDLRAVPDGDRLEQIQAVARLLDPLAFRDDEPEGVKRALSERRHNALLRADRVLAAGWVKAPDDEQMIERVARSLSAQALARYSGSPDGLDWDSDTEESRAEFRFIVRAVLAVLRGGEQP